MKKPVMLWVVMLLLCGSSLMAQTQTSHQKAAETLLLTMGTPKNIDENLQQMLTMQMEQVPAMKAAEVEVRSFFAKYMNWDALKTDLVKVYTEEFTEKELRDLNTFFSSAAGKKLASKQTTLTVRTAQLGQEKVQPHLMELQQIIQQKMMNEN